MDQGDDEAIHARPVGEEGDRFTPLERLLFDCLRARDHAATLERLKGLSDPEWTSLIDLADEQMVGPTLRHHLLSPVFTPALPYQIRQLAGASQRRTAMANMRIHSDFRRVVLALQARAIPVIALKGLHLISLVYGDLALRTTGDIDLLVPARDLTSAGVVVEELGYAPLTAYHVSRRALPYCEHHLPRFIKRGETPVEIHWHITGPDSTLSIDVENVWDRAVPARIAGVDALVFSPEDLLLHLCVHATYSHLCEVSTRPWCDLAQTIRRHSESMDWVQIVARAGRWRCRRGTYLALRLARDLLSAAVPDDVLESLKPAEFDERILRLAMLQRHRNSGLNVPFVQAWNQHTLAGRLRTCWSRVFLPKDQLAGMYNLPRFSRLVYALRLKDLVKRHWRTAVRLQRGDAALTELDRRSIALLEFLAEP